MAIVQISRITQRKGLEEDLPQPLAGAELGWAIDQRRLFIGNGELEEGAPTVGNTEILTEYSDILALAATYTYQGAAAGYVVQTGPTAGNPVSLNLQSWLDQWATVKDFGATGDGVTDDTDAINRALFQLYCRQSNTQIRRKLFFPAGTYKISDTLLIPPYATLYGEGPENSIISFEVETWSSTVGYDAGELVEDSGSYYRALLEVPAGTSLGNTTYWDPTTLPDHVASTVDSLQQSGVDIGTNGATAPTSITVTNMKFSTTVDTISLLLVEKCVNSSFNQTDFQGPLSAAQLYVANLGQRAVDFESSGALPCTAVRFNGCKFSGLAYATNVTDEIIGCAFDQCWFDTLYQGVILGGAVVTNGGPTGTRIMHSLFDNIALQGIYIENCSMNVSGYNAFYDVGNNFFGTGFPASPVIDIFTSGNESVGDMFERPTSYIYANARIQLNQTASIGYEGAEQLQLGTYTRTTGVKTTLPDNTTATLFTLDAILVRAFRIEYTITRNTATDATVTGTFTVVASTDGAGTDLAYNDDFVQNDDTGVTLSVSETASVITVTYTTSAAGYDGYIYYSVTKLA